MMYFYTPKQWYSLFPCPSLVIDNDGKIWAADKFYKVLYQEPSGKIDFKNGKIYGKDMGYGLFAEPIAYMETKNGVTRIMDANEGIFSAPILYIRDNKVYTPEEWTSLIATPQGYLRDDQPSGGADSVKEPRKPARMKFALGGEFALLVGIALFLILGNGVDAMFRAPIWLLPLGVFAMTIFILHKVSGGRENILLRLSMLSSGMDSAQVSLCKLNAAICAGLLFAVLPAAMALCFMRIIGTLAFLTSMSGPLMIMLIAVMGALYWLEYLAFRNGMLLGKIGLWPIRKMPESQREAAQRPSYPQPERQPVPEARMAAPHPEYELPPDKPEPVSAGNDKAAPSPAPEVSRKSPQPETPSADSNKKAAPQKVKVKVVPKKQPKK